MRRARLQNEETKQFEWITEVYEVPIGRLPHYGFPPYGYPQDGLADGRKPGHILNTDSPSTESLNTEKEKTDELSERVPANAGEGFQPSTLSIYQEVTHIKKPKSKIVKWAKEWDDLGFDENAMREAILECDTNNLALDCQELDAAYMRRDRYSWRADRMPYNYKIDTQTGEAIGINYIVDGEEQIPASELLPIALRKFLADAIKYQREKIAKG